MRYILISAIFLSSIFATDKNITFIKGKVHYHGGYAHSHEDINSTKAIPSKLVRDLPIRDIP